MLRSSLRQKSCQLLKAGSHPARSLCTTSQTPLRMSSKASSTLKSTSKRYTPITQKRYAAAVANAPDPNDSFLSGNTANYIDEMYMQWKEDPKSVHVSWQVLRDMYLKHIFDRLVLTHTTTTEFLHHFWLVFLSGDADKANELAQLVTSLDRAMDRINAVAADAEKEREDAIRIKKEHIKNVYEKTKKKIHWKAESVGGGQKVVMEMMDPTIKTLQKATKEYRRALAAEGVMDTS